MNSVSSPEEEEILESEVNWRELDLKKVLFWTSAFSVFIDSTLYPAEVVKTRLQVQTNNHGLPSSCPHYKSTADAFRQIWRQEGVFGKKSLDLSIELRFSRIFCENITFEMFVNFITSCHIS